MNASIRQVCQERYPDNVGVWGACKRNAFRGLRDFETIREKFAGDGAMEASLANCYQRYTERGTTNFTMLGACARNQQDGYFELAGPSMLKTMHWVGSELAKLH